MQRSGPRAGQPSRRPRAATPDDAPAAEPAGPAPLEIRAKVWIEAGGQVVLSTWRIELLEAIGRTGSLVEAAAALNVPYRTAWYKLRDAEIALGGRLVVGRSGGRQGGGSRLTPAAEDYIRRFRAISRDLEAEVAARFQAALGPDRPSAPTEPPTPD